MNNDILKDLKKCHQSLIDDLGNWKNKADEYLVHTIDKNVEILKSILGIVLRSDNLSTETKIFISRPLLSIKGVNEEINRLRLEAQGIKKECIRPLSYNNTVLKIGQDNTKLKGILKIEDIRDLIYNRVDDYNNIEKTIYNLINEFGNCDKSRNNLILNIDDSKIKCNSYKNNEEFFDILGSLENYLVQRKTIIENVINGNEEFVEYFNYLLNSESLNNKEVLRDRERLLKFLNNEDYITGYESELIEIEKDDIKEYREEVEENSDDSSVIDDYNFEDDGVEI